MDRDGTDQRFGQPLVIRNAHPDDVAMGSDCECDELFCSDSRIPQKRHLMRLSERRHSSQFTVGEDPGKFALICQANV